jgi:nitric oxide reductase large subunit
VDKVFLLTLGKSAKFNKIHEDNHRLMTAKQLYETFYSCRSFAVSNGKPNANQYYKFDYNNIPFSFDDYLKVKENNCIFTDDQQEAIIDSLKWNIWSQKADIKLKINKLYTNNFKATYLEPDGR